VHTDHEGPHELQGWWAGRRDCAQVCISVTQLHATAMHAALHIDGAQLISTASASEHSVARRAAARALETVQPDALYRDPLAETLAGEDAMVYVRNTSMGLNPKVWSANCTQTLTVLRGMFTAACHGVSYSGATGSVTYEYAQQTEGPHRVGSIGSRWVSMGPMLVALQQEDFPEQATFMGTLPDASGAGAHRLGTFHIRTKVGLPTSV
jgi:hypothetical protein